MKQLSCIVRFFDKFTGVYIFHFNPPRGQGKKMMKYQAEEKGKRKKEEKGRKKEKRRKRRKKEKKKKKEEKEGI